MPEAIDKPNDKLPDTPQENPINTISKPIAENEHVQELLKILQENNSPSIKDMFSVVQQITAMEKHLASAVNELSNMRTQLADMEARNHPIKNTLQKACIAMQAQVLDLRDKLAELKQDFIEGCKNAVTAFREKGISALDNMAKFFKIKPALESVRNSCNKTIAIDNKAITNIETVSKEYHEAGKHLKNMARAIFGKEPTAEAKPMGSLAKALIAPYKAERKCFTAMKSCAEKAIGSLSRLEERAEKPSIQGAIKTFSEKISQEQAAQAKTGLTIPERPVINNEGR